MSLSSAQESSTERTSAGNDTHDKQLENPCQCHVAECLQQAPRVGEEDEEEEEEEAVVAT